MTEQEERILARTLAAKYPDEAWLGLRDASMLRGSVSTESVVRAITEAYECSPADLAQFGRTKDLHAIFRCRATVTHVLNNRLLFNIGRPTISKQFLGNRDNATVIYNLKTWLVRDAQYYLAIRNVCNLMEWGNVDEVVECLEGNTSK